MTSRDLIAALLAVLGVYEIVQGLHQAAYLTPFYWDPDALPRASSPTNATAPMVLGRDGMRPEPELWPERMGVLAQLALGAFLAVGGKAIARALGWLRQGGKRPAASTD